MRTFAPKIRSSSHVSRVPVAFTPARRGLHEEQLALHTQPRASRGSLPGVIGLHGPGGHNRVDALVEGFA